MDKLKFGLWVMIGLAFILAMIFKPEPDRSSWERCTYKYKVYDSDHYERGYTNERPGVDTCVETTKGVYCGTMLLKPTIKGTKKCRKKER